MTSRSGSGPLCRDHLIPLNRQLAAGLEAAIRDGHIRPGAPLPSTRDLARRLEVDRSTVSAAYARLRRRRCISGVQGRRTRAAGGIPTPTPPESAVLTPASLAEPAIRRVLGEAFCRGLSRSAVAEAFAERLPGPDRVTPALFEPRPGLRQALGEEIRCRTGVDVKPVGRFARIPLERPVFVRREVLEALRARGAGGPETEWLPLDLCGGTRERGFVRRGVRSGVVVLLSVSAAIRGYAAELAVREFSRGVSFVALDPRESDEVVRASAVARLLLHDAASRPIVSTGARTVEISLLSVAQIAAIQGYLGGPRRRCGT